jgi:hypothetical protein
MGNITLAIFSLLLIFVAGESKALSSSQEQAMINALSTPEGRKAFKLGIDSWGDYDKAVFQNSLKRKVEQEFVPSLPMRINQFMTWLDLRIMKDRLVLTVQFSDDVIENSLTFNDYLNNFDSYICSTPINILLMMIGYSIQSSFYDSRGKFIESKVLSESDCNF